MEGVTYKLDRVMCVEHASDRYLLNQSNALQIFWS